MIDAGLLGLQVVRGLVHGCFTRRADALFEALDALLCAEAVPSLPHLSLVGGHRRGWGSVYAALSRGRIDEDALRDLLAEVMVGWPLHGAAGEGAAGEGAGATSPSQAPPMPVFAVDASSWPRCDAEASPERGLYYHPSRHSAGQPIVAGWSYQWVAQVGFARDSWTVPVDVRRVRPLHNANTVAVEQVTALVERLDRQGAGSAGSAGSAESAEKRPVPLFVFDAGYDPGGLQLGLQQAGGRREEPGGVPAAILVRLRSDRCFYADPPPRPPGAIGRPQRHGAKFACRDQATWPAPDAELVVADDAYGRVDVRAWAGLHPKQTLHPGLGSRGPKPILRGTLLRVQVTRLPTPTRPPKVLWLWHAGPGALTPTPELLDVLWRAYIRRFDVEHTLRFVKQTLAWTTPRVRTPEQADRWTWLVVAAYALLRLARVVVADRRLPWERARC